jgi:hypothetical protein
LIAGCKTADASFYKPRMKLFSMRHQADASRNFPHPDAVEGRTIGRQQRADGPFGCVIGSGPLD